jgi:hypothetical protein
VARTAPAPYRSASAWRARSSSTTACMLTTFDAPAAAGVPGLSTGANEPGMLPTMNDPASSPNFPPPKSPERAAEIRRLLARIAEGDLSGTTPWEEVADELDLPSRT